MYPTNSTLDGGKFRHEMQPATVPVREPDAPTNDLQTMKILQTVSSGDERGD